MCARPLPRIGAPRVELDGPNSIELGEFKSFGERDPTLSELDLRDPRLRDTEPHRDLDLGQAGLHSGGRGKPAKCQVARGPSLEDFVAGRWHVGTVPRTRGRRNPILGLTTSAEVR